MQISAVKKQKEVMTPEGIALTVLLSYPALPPDSAREKPSHRSKKKPRRARKTKKDVWSLSEFRQLQEKTFSLPEEGGGETAVPEEIPRGLSRAFSYIEKIAEGFFRQKTREPAPAAESAPPSASGVRRTLSFSAEMTALREDAVSFLCRAETRERRLLSFHVFALTFSLPRGTVAFSPAFAGKAARQAARGKFASLGEICHIGELSRNFYLSEDGVVFFKNRFDPASHSQRERDFFLTVKTDAESLS